MKKAILVNLFVFFVIFAGTAYAEPIEGSDAEVTEIAEPMLDNIMEGFQNNDYERYSRDLDDMVKETVTEEKFPNVRQQIQLQVGTYQSRQYLGFLTKGSMTMVLWKGVFDGTDDDVLIKLVISKRGPKHLVTGLWFQ